MNKKEFYDTAIELIKTIAQKHNLLNEVFIFKSAALSVEQAIGKPDRKDFPLMKGKEVLIQTDYKGFKGQAYTDMPGNWSATLDEILNIEPVTNFDRAMLVSSLNAVCTSLGLCKNTIHCKDNQPEECAREYLNYIKTNYKDCKRVGLIGLQPSLLQMLSENFDTRALDLDPDKIKTVKYGVTIEDSEEFTRDVINWADLVVCTGSTVINASIVEILNLCKEANKPVLFFGTSIAGTACLMGLERFCPKAL